MRFPKKLMLGLVATATAASFPVTMAPGAAAASANISGTQCTCGTWTTFGNIREKDKYGNITLKVTNNVSTTLVVTLVKASTGDVFTTERAFHGAPVTKAIATGVQDQTRFKIRSRMYEDWNGDNYWAGEPLTY